MKQGTAVSHPDLGYGLYVGKKKGTQLHLFVFHNLGVRELASEAFGSLDTTADIQIGTARITLKPEELLEDPDEVVEGLGDKNAYGKYVCLINLGYNLDVTAIKIQVKGIGKVLANATVTLNGILTIEDFTIWQNKAEAEGINVTPPRNKTYRDILTFNPNNNTSTVWKTLQGFIMEAYQKEIAE